MPQQKGVYLNKNSEEEIANLNRMLAALLNYISDDTEEEIDIDYILDKTEGLRDWWNQYRENNKKEIEKEVAKALKELSLEDLESIREQIKEKQDKK
ncbi:hypothetical protein [Niallia sp. 03133]|uniref:hypothetical protein n=1 Tax=Niallia sp. 03133 TaxID=3458060 RepID=UPI004043BFC3